MGCSSADADCRTVYRNHSYNRIVYDTVVVAEFVPLVAYPAYALTYQPVQDEVGKLQLELRLARQDAEILRLRVELQGMQGRSLAPTPQKGQPIVEPEIVKPELSVTHQTCARCHDKGGQGPQFFTSGVLTATPEQRLEMIDAVMTERMPKGTKTTDEVATKIMFELAKRKKSV